MKLESTPDGKHNRGIYNEDLAFEEKERKEIEMEEKALVTAENKARQEVTIFKADKALERVDEVIKFIEGLRARLKEGEDYDKHPGYHKPSLEKPGAEKICAALNCGTEIIKTTANVIQSQYGLKEYELVLGLKNRVNGAIMGEGVGYGRADEKDLFTWDKEQNKKVLKPDRAEWANNTALKMAYKSALICATLSAGALSGYFTQDLEEIKNDKQTPKPKPAPKQPKATGDLTEVLHFGKYKGKSLQQIHQVNSHYLGWLIEQDWFQDKNWASLRDKVAIFLDAHREVDEFTPEGYD